MLHQSWQAIEEQHRFATLEYLWAEHRREGLEAPGGGNIPSRRYRPHSAGLSRFGRERPWSQAIGDVVRYLVARVDEATSHRRPSTDSNAHPARVGLPVIRSTTSDRIFFFRTSHVCHMVRHDIPETWGSHGILLTNIDATYFFFTNEIPKVVDIAKYYHTRNVWAYLGSRCEISKYTGIAMSCCTRSFQ